MNRLWAPWRMAYVGSARTASACVFCEGLGSPAELADAMRLVALATRALTAEYRAEGFNIGVNQGRIAGAGIADHLHIHVGPRFNGDTNFIPVLGDVRVLPESLEATVDRLRGRLVG